MSTLLNFKVLQVGDKFTVDGVEYTKVKVRSKTCCSPKMNAVREGKPKPMWFDDAQAVEVE